MLSEAMIAVFFATDHPSSSIGASTLLRPPVDAARHAFPGLHARAVQPRAARKGGVAAMVRAQQRKTTTKKCACSQLTAHDNAPLAAAQGRGGDGVPPGRKLRSRCATRVRRCLQTAARLAQRRLTRSKTTPARCCPPARRNAARSRRQARRRTCCSRPGSLSSARPDAGRRAACAPPPRWADARPRVFARTTRACVPAGRRPSAPRRLRATQSRTTAG